MNEPRPFDPELERRLRDWLGGQAAAGPGDAELLASVAATTRSVDQDRGLRAWLGRSGRPTRVGRRGGRHMLLVAAVLTTAGAALLISVGSPPSEPSSDWAIYPRLPADLPEAVETGTHETPIGPARWVHLVGGLDSWPVYPRPVPGPDGGLIDIEEGGSHPQCEVVLEEHENPDGTGWMRVEECSTEPGWWTSPDGITWTREPLPFAEVDTLDLVGGTYWLRRSNPLSAPRPPGLWRSQDTEEWTPIDLSAVGPPLPDDLGWRMEIGRPVSALGVTVVPILWNADLNVQETDRLLGLAVDDAEMGRLEAAGPGRFTIRSLTDESEIGSIVAEETSTGLRLVDAQSGRLLSELKGVGMDFIDRWAAHGDIVEQRLAVIDGAVATPVTLPGAPLFLPEQGFDALTLFGAPDGFVAFNRMPDGGYRSWTSPNGRTWDERGPLRIGNALPQDMSISVEADVGDRPAIVAWTADGVMESFDGEAWQPAEVDSDGDRALAVPGGWFSTAYGRFEIRAPAGAWEPLADGIYDRNSSDEGYDGRIGDTWFVNSLSRDGDAPRQDLWIVQFEADPGD